MCRLKLSSVTSRHSAASEWLKPQIKPAYPLALKRRRLAAGLIYVTHESPVVQHSASLSCTTFCHVRSSSVDTVRSQRSRVSDTTHVRHAYRRVSPGAARDSRSRTPRRLALSSRPDLRRPYASEDEHITAALHPCCRPSYAGWLCPRPTCQSVPTTPDHTVAQTVPGAARAPHRSYRIRCIRHSHKPWPILHRGSRVAAAALGRSEIRS